MTSQMENSKSLSQSQINGINQSTNRTHSSLDVITVRHSLKVTLLGDSSVGKTSIITKYCKDIFNPDNANPTINVSILEKVIRTDAFTEVKLSIWDTAGAEKYISFTKNYLRESNGIILVFDLTKKKSFENLDMWIGNINDVIEEDKVVKILVGNKSDLPDKEIDENEVKKYAGEHGMKYLSVSAKEGINIDYLFEVMANDCVKKLKKNQEKKENGEVKEDKIDEAKENEDKISILSIDNNNAGNNKNKKTKKKGKCC